MNSALRRHVESLSRASLAEMLGEISVVLREFERSPHLSRKQEALLMFAAQSLDAAVKLWADAVERHVNARCRRTPPTLEPLPKSPVRANDCVSGLIDTYNALKDANLTRGQVQRLTIAAYNLLVVGKEKMGGTPRSAL